MNKWMKYCWIGCTMFLLGLGISMPSEEPSGLDENKESCTWGYFCNDNGIEFNWINKVKIQNCVEYNPRVEGIVSRGSPYFKSFFKTLDNVVKVSKEECNETIKFISNEDSFEEIYNKYITLFQESYSAEIDNCLSRDYIQNIDELVFNDYQGDCDDYALWLYIIAKEKGLDVRYVIGYRESGGHAWIQIKIDDEWIDYDSTSNSIGKDVVSKKYLKRHFYRG